MTDGAIAATGPADPVAGGDRRYLRQFDLYRVVAFLGVIWQHSILWPVPGGSKSGWSMVMFLHATREIFFVLSAFVAAYSQLLRPRPLVTFWYRRIGAIAVPYLVWTAIYLVYSFITTPPATAGGAWSTAVHDLLNGYYQLYFLVVLFQVYVVLPGLLWLVRRTRGHHGWVLGASLAFQLAMMTVSHYFSWRTGAAGVVRKIDLHFIGSRVIVGYQVYVVVGVLAAAHFGEVQRVLDRHWRRIAWGVVGLFVLTEGYYVYGLEIGNTPGHASDLYQPVAVVWFLAAAVGLAAVGTGWAQRAARRPAPNRLDRAITWASDASGGYYLAHVLVLELIFSLLAHEGLTGPSTWGASSVVLFVGTVAGTGVLVDLLMRTRLRWILTGPDRSAERAAWPWYPSEAEAGQAPSAAAAGAGVSSAASTASAMSR